MNIQILVLFFLSVFFLFCLFLLLFVSFVLFCFVFFPRSRPVSSSFYFLILLVLICVSWPFRGCMLSFTCQYWHLLMRQTQYMQNKTDVNRCVEVPEVLLPSGSFPSLVLKAPCLHCYLFSFPWNHQTTKSWRKNEQLYIDEHLRSSVLSHPMHY